jgi:hypothetical protein
MKLQQSLKIIKINRKSYSTLFQSFQEDLQTFAGQGFNLMNSIKQIRTALKRRINIMKLFLLSQNENNEYDTYDSAVVAAEDEESAKQINIDEYSSWGSKSSSWCSSPDKVNVKYLGEAAEGILSGIILASFNAGF